LSPDIHSTLSLIMNKTKIFQFSLVGLILFQIAQSMEQIMNKFTSYIPIITEKLHRKIAFFPAFEMHDNIFMLVSLALIVAVIVVAALIFLDLKWAKTAIIIVAIYGVLAGLLPLLLSIYFKEYFPGAYTGAGMIVCSLIIFFTSSSFHLPEFEE
jgi:hypothetical protein